MAYMIDMVYVVVIVSMNYVVMWIVWGRQYLVDVGFPNTIELMTSYRGVRELFNFRHASLRNAIELAFGVLKRRFSIVRSTHELFLLV
uniref:DDE Tnp4 domain-containing protein n=1 Tax=Lactuca sativa TaxID=4236 RepID=A0A9R1X109_LACSA|nr:hypothetical protein LSAT_V11C800417570 [Lactuca sativa]